MIRQSRPAGAQVFAKSVTPGTTPGLTQKLGIDAERSNSAIKVDVQPQTVRQLPAAAALNASTRGRGISSQVDSLPTTPLPVNHDADGASGGRVVTPDVLMRTSARAADTAGQG